MTSLLSVCLALLLPACVLGQWPIHYGYLISQCQGHDAFDTYRKCLKTLSPDIMTSESKCRDVFNEMTKCLGDVLHGCLQQEYRGLILTDAMATDMVFYECQYMTANYSCASGINISHCGVLPPNATVDYVTSMCTYLHEAANCLKEGLNCNGSSVSFADAFFQKSIPPACGPGGTEVPLASIPLGTVVPLASTPFGTDVPLTSTPLLIALVLLKMAAVL